MSRSSGLYFSLQFLALRWGDTGNPHGLLLPLGIRYSLAYTHVATGIKYDHNG